jgi:hypothetical protein
VFVKSSIFDVTLPLVSALSGKRLDTFLELLRRRSDRGSLAPVFLYGVQPEQRGACEAPARVGGQGDPVELVGAGAVRACEPGRAAPRGRAVLNNLPAELAKKEARGRTVAVNVIQAADPKLWSPLARGGGL